jgi:hypothetical protein
MPQSSRPIEPAGAAPAGGDISSIDPWEVSFPGLARSSK